MTLFGIDHLDVTKSTLETILRCWIDLRKHSSHPNPNKIIFIFKQFYHISPTTNAKKKNEHRLIYTHPISSTPMKETGKNGGSMLFRHPDIERAARCSGSSEISPIPDQFRSVRSPSHLERTFNYANVPFSTSHRAFFSGKTRDKLAL